ncbi:hypothetical protein DL93DRAFT_2123975 [Clavulina sp. PMI_390]|nr:hypothetical protein DL93DRAFT_2123975 [Clavulina sp. PMI_390]
MKFSPFVAVLGLGALVGSVMAHGVVTSPTPRKIGSANLAACGTGVYNSLKADAVKKIDSGYNATACHLYFCRGYQAADNTGENYSYSLGQVVPMTVDIEAHHTGYANVSVVNVVTQTVIGSPLIYWPVYANSSLSPAEWPVNQTSFSVTIPTSLGTNCAKSGTCALQWWWYAAYSNKETFESCIDFTAS